LECEICFFFGQLQIALEDTFGALEGFAGAELFGEFGVGTFEASHLDFSADEETDGGDEANFALAVGVRLAVLQIDDADEFVAAENRDGEESFETVFGQLVEGLKARVFERVTGDGDGTFVFGNPAGDSAADLELQAVDDFRVGIFRGTEDEFVVLEYVEKTGIKFCDDGNEIEYFCQEFVQRVGGGDATADLVKQINFTAFLLQ